MSLTPIPQFTSRRRTVRDRVVQVIGPVPLQLHQLLVQHGAMTIARDESTVYVVPLPPIPLSD